MEVPVTCHGDFLYSVLANITPVEHESILKHKWYKLKGQPDGTSEKDPHNFSLKLPTKFLAPCGVLNFIRSREFHFKIMGTPGILL